MKAIIAGEAFLRTFSRRDPMGLTVTRERLQKVKI